MRRSNENRARIIEFWRAVELFSPQNVPKVDPRGRVYRVTAGDPLPWEAGHDLQRVRLDSRMTWRHTVYGGVFSLARVRKRLEEEFGADAESLDAARPGDSALFAVTVTHDGRPILGLQELSSCAWAIGRTVRPGTRSPYWLDGFAETAEACDERFERLVAALEDDEVAAELNRQLKDKGLKVGRPIGYKKLVDHRDFIRNEFGCGEVLEPAEIRVKSVPVSVRRQYSEDGSDFLNSFIADDLERVARAIRNGDYGAALDAYLRDGEQSAQAQQGTQGGQRDRGRRVDVVHDLDTVYQGVAPTSVPLGRWPAASERALSLSQQFAVDTLLADIAPASGLFAVNGPPGTGKTTMLRDLIAAIVVERARRLADLPGTGAAFGERLGWQTGKYRRVIHSWKPQFAGFEMVVASANNSAVENVSLETPRASEIAAEWRSEAGYFAELATQVVRAAEKDVARKRPNPAPAAASASASAPDATRGTEPDAAWGLLAARLGNKRNRREFVSAFWFSDPKTEATGMLDMLKEWEVRSPSSSASAASPAPQVSASRVSSPASSPWRAAVRRFRAAEQAATALLNERAMAFSQLESLPRLVHEQDRQREELTLSRRRRDDIDRQLADATRPLTALAAAVAERERQRREHLAYKPGLIESLFSRGRLHEWRAEDGVLADAVGSARRKLQAAQDDADRLAASASAAHAEAKDNQERLGELDRQVAATEDAISRARRDLGDALPIAGWWDDDERRELSAPWTDAAWNAARTRLFLAALDLHRAFVVAEAERMRQNLWGAIDILQGDVPADAPPAAVRAAWQSLFFVVPLVSTTFASFDRVFSHLGRESLGWLFIDEAGQATPQQPVGAIWRAQRAVIIGDPLQLEPVVTLPFTAQQALRRHFDVAETWLPDRISAQGLADQANRYGTYLPGDIDPVWVGAPLRVHRRCDEPMFGISNAVAYDGLMIYGVPPRGPVQPAGYPDPPDSKWVDMRADHAQDHWIPAEGAQLRFILVQLRERYGIGPDRVIAITPFRQVADQLKKIARDFPGLEAGTIHTAQGREADIVVFVLGGNPSKDGAKRWAASTPNLVNVAVSRAKRRLYVIGDRTAWKRHRYFDRLAANLPAAPPVRDFPGAE
jgi:hypothetical protein